MNKTANCIKMLKILHGRKGGEPISKQEIADLLDINPRNIVEYKKELEEAGYDIEFTNGPHGGYSLGAGATMPTLNLDQSEYDALIEAEHYLNVHDDFPVYNDFKSALMNIKCGYARDNNGDTKYFDSSSTHDNKEVAMYMKEIDRAIKEHKEISFEYRRSAGNNEFFKVRLQPYAYFYKEMKFYVNGYVTNNRSGKAFHNYAISTERMKNLHVQEDKKFSRDMDYKLEDYVGKSSVVKEDEIHLVLKVDKSLRFYVSERRNGYNYSVEDFEDYLIVRTTFDNHMVCDAYILSLGAMAEVLEPMETRERIKRQIHNLADMYK